MRGKIRKKGKADDQFFIKKRERNGNLLGRWYPRGIYLVNHLSRGNYLGTSLLLSHLIILFSSLLPRDFCPTCQKPWWVKLIYAGTDSRGLLPESMSFLTFPNSLPSLPFSILLHIHPFRYYYHADHWYLGAWRSKDLIWGEIIMIYYEKYRRYGKLLNTGRCCRK